MSRHTHSAGRCSRQLPVTSAACRVRTRHHWRERVERVTGRRYPPGAGRPEAVVALHRAEGAGRVPFSAFYTGYRQSVMRSDELIAALEVPRLPGPSLVQEGRHPRGAGDLEGGHGCGRPGVG
jgi:hypothetical protein